jgi:galactose mutarotase-like enzyme
MIKTFVLSNKIGDTITLQDRGAAIKQWSTLIAGKETSLLIEDDSVPQVRNLGAVVGPIAGTLSEQEVEINQKTIRLYLEQGKLVDSGTSALDQGIWTVKAQSERAITFTYWLENGFKGLPGPMTFEVEYRLAETKSQLKVNLSAIVEQATLIAPSCIPCFDITRFDKLEVNNANEREDFHLYDRTTIHLATDNRLIANEDSQLHAILKDTKNTIALQIYSDYPSSTLTYIENNQGLIIKPSIDFKSTNERALAQCSSGMKHKIIYKLYKD